MHAREMAVEQSLTDAEKMMVKALKNDTDAMCNIMEGLSEMMENMECHELR